MRALPLLLFLLLGGFFSKSLYSQYYYYNDRYYDNDILFELGAGVGAMNCVTDVGGANSQNSFYVNAIRSQFFKFSYSIYAEAMYRHFFGVRLEGTWGKIESADRVVKGTSLNQTTKFNRNFAFRSKINEVALLGELHPLQLLNFENGPPLLSPYIIGGLGWFSFNPQAPLNGKWINLQPLHTEGQGFSEYPDRKPYRLSQFNIPMGLGLHYEFSSIFNIRAEFLHRKLFTDYLDDAHNSFYINPALFTKYLSHADAANAMILYNPSLDGRTPPRRANPKNNDAYLTFSLKLSVTLGRETIGGRGSTRQLRCF